MSPDAPDISTIDMDTDGNPIGIPVPDSVDISCRGCNTSDIARPKGHFSPINAPLTLVTSLVALLGLHATQHTD